MTIYQEQRGIRSLPIGQKLQTLFTNAAADAGVDVHVFSGGQHARGSVNPSTGKPYPHTGSTRHDEGNAGDIYLTMNGRKLREDNPADLPIIQTFIRSAVKNGATGIGAGAGYMGVGNLHVGFGRSELKNAGLTLWGPGEISKTTPAWLRQAASGVQRLPPADIPNPPPTSTELIAGAGRPRGALGYADTGGPPGGPPTLRKGATDARTGGAVTRLQQQLAAVPGGPPVAVDGKYGPQTEAAVRAVEKKYRLTQERPGKAAAGPQVQAALAGNERLRTVTDTRQRFGDPLAPGGFPSVPGAPPSIPPAQASAAEAAGAPNRPYTVQRGGISSGGLPDVVAEGLRRHAQFGPNLNDPAMSGRFYPGGLYGKAGAGVGFAQPTSATLSHDFRPPAPDLPPLFSDADYAAAAAQDDTRLGQGPAPELVRLAQEAAARKAAAPPAPPAYMEPRVVPSVFQKGDQAVSPSGGWTAAPVQDITSSGIPGQPSPLTQFQRQQLAAALPGAAASKAASLPYPSMVAGRPDVPVAPNTPRGTSINDVIAGIQGMPGAIGGAIGGVGNALVGAGNAVSDYFQGGGPPSVTATPFGARPPPTAVVPPAVPAPAPQSGLDAFLERENAAIDRLASKPKNPAVDAAWRIMRNDPANRAAEQADLWQGILAFQRAGKVYTDSPAFKNLRLSSNIEDRRGITEPLPPAIAAKYPNGLPPGMFLGHGPDGKPDGSLFVRGNDTKYLPQGPVPESASLVPYGGYVPGGYDRGRQDYGGPPQQSSLGGYPQYAGDVPGGYAPSGWTYSDRGGPQRLARSVIEPSTASLFGDTSIPRDVPSGASIPIYNGPASSPSGFGGVGGAYPVPMPADPFQQYPPSYYDSGYGTRENIRPSMSSPGTRSLDYQIRQSYPQVASGGPFTGTPTANPGSYSGYPYSGGGLPRSPATVVPTSPSASVPRDTAAPYSMSDADFSAAAPWSSPSAAPAFAPAGDQTIAPAGTVDPFGAGGVYGVNADPNRLAPGTLDTTATGGVPATGDFERGNPYFAGGRGPMAAAPVGTQYVGAPKPRVTFADRAVPALASMVPVIGPLLAQITKSAMRTGSFDNAQPYRGPIQGRNYATVMTSGGVPALTQWGTRQYSTGSSLSNSPFTPLGVGWRAPSFDPISGGASYAYNPETHTYIDSRGNKHPY